MDSEFNINLYLIFMLLAAVASFILLRRGLRLYSEDKGKGMRHIILGVLNILLWIALALVAVLKR